MLYRALKHYIPQYNQEDIYNINKGKEDNNKEDRLQLELKKP